MRIMCLNGWGGRLHDDLVAYVGAERPDVLCLQEVTHGPAGSSAWLTYRDGAHVLPQRASVFRDVSAVLPGHAAAFCPAAEGVLWDGDAALPSRWGLATYVDDTAYPIIGQVQGFVHKSYSPDGFGDHPRSRTAHAVRLHDRAAGRTVTIAHMHGLRDPAAGKRDTAERRVQAERLLAIVRAVKEPGDALVVCGDFNVEPDSATFAVLAPLGLTELVTANGHPGTRTSHYGKPGRFADYMLVGSVEAIRFDVVRTPEVSDHCPLVLEI